MRPDSLRRWRSRASLAIVVGLVGGLVLAAYSIFWQAANGLASPACGGGGCEDRLRADDAHYQRLLYVALVVGGGLVVAGIAARHVLGKRLRRAEAVPFAEVVQRPESGREVP